MRDVERLIGYRELGCDGCVGGKDSHLRERGIIQGSVKVCVDDDAHNRACEYIAWGCRVKSKIEDFAIYHNHKGPSSLHNHAPRYSELIEQEASLARTSRTHTHSLTENAIKKRGQGHIVDDASARVPECHEGVLAQSCVDPFSAHSIGRGIGEGGDLLRGQEGGEGLCFQSCIFRKCRGRGS